MLRGQNGPNSNNHTVPKQKDIIKHPFMKRHSYKPKLNQLIITINFPSSRVLCYLGVEFANKNHAV